MYETRRFCFISIQKGMALNFMIPVTTMILLTTLFALNGIRKINIKMMELEYDAVDVSSMMKKELQYWNDDVECDSNVESKIIWCREGKQHLRSLCIIQTSYCTVWFVTVLAVENVQTSIGMCVAYFIVMCALVSILTISWKQKMCEYTIFCSNF